MWDQIRNLISPQFLLQAGITCIALFYGVSQFIKSSEKKAVEERRKSLKSVSVSPAKNGEGEVRRHPKAKDGLVETYSPTVKTLFDVFQLSLEQCKNDRCLGARKKNANNTFGEYEWISYADVAKRRDNLGAGLIKLGHKTDDPLGIYSINRAEWVLTDLACQAYRFPSVALYDTLGQNAVEFIIKHAEIKTAVCASKQLKTLLIAAKNGCPLKVLVAMDDITEEQKTLATETKVELYHISEVEKMGAEKPVPHNPPKGEDIYTIMYTSGTTGDPKGVLLAHSNFVSEIGALRLFQDRLFSTDDYHCSYLPLAHSFERAVIYTIVSYGGKIGFWQGHIEQLSNDILTLQPTFLVGAPRVWTRIYDKTLQTVNNGSPLAKALFNMAFKAKQQALKDGSTTPFWDKLVFGKTKARLGGKVRFILSGSAPLDPKLGEFLKICFCCPVLEGYGLTENAAGAFVTNLDETELGHVGGPLPSLECKLLDVPDMNYSSKNTPPTGEILIRGGNLFKGYYKDPEKTKEALEADGWFHTGDIGRWNPNGTLSIIDRKKNIFKLSQGEYVAVEHLEAIFLQCTLIGQIWVYGNSFKRYLVGIVVPDSDVAIQWAKQNNESGDLKTLVQSAKFNAAVLKEMNEKGKSSGLQGFEYVKAIKLTTDVFTVDNDLMTPTFKLRREKLIKYFQKEIDQLYDSLPDA